MLEGLDAVAWDELDHALGDGTGGYALLGRVRRAPRVR